MTRRPIHILGHCSASRRMLARSSWVRSPVVLRRRKISRKPQIRQWQF
ncbi:hypothetical protein [Rubritalea tangerina]